MPDTVESMLAAADDAHRQGRIDDEIDLRLNAFFRATLSGARPAEQVERAAHLLCDLGEGLADPGSDEQWKAATRHADKRFGIIEGAVLELVKAQLPERAFRITQRVKSPTLVRRLRAHTAARPDLSPLGRRFLELLRAESAARNALRDEQRRGCPAEEAARRVAELDSLAGKLREVEAELRKKNPEEFASLGGVLEPEDLLHVFPPDGSACWVDLFFTHEATVLLLLSRQGDRIETTAVLHSGLRLRDILDASAAWLKALHSPGTAEEGLRQLMSFLHARLMCGLGKILRSRGHWQITLLPHLTAHALPLHLAPLCEKQGKDFFFEEFAVAYAPCAQLALTTALRARPEAFIRGKLEASLFADPTEDLPAARREQEVAVDRLAHHPWPAAPAPAQCASGAAVTAASVERGIGGAGLVVLGCHARFVASDPFGSGLILHGAGDKDEIWTVDRIFTQPELRAAPVVVLSACESGMSYFNEASEIVSLPPAFVTIGASAVIASLWPVEDVCTSFLVERFIHHLMDPGETPATALSVACQDLRRLSRQAALARCDEILMDMEQRGANFGAGQTSYLRLSAVRQRIEKGPEHPFASPFLWGGFFVMGCGWRLIGGKGVQRRGARDVAKLPLAVAGVRDAADLFQRGEYAEARQELSKAIPDLDGIWLGRALLLHGDCIYRGALRSKGVQLILKVPAKDREELELARRSLRRAHELLLAEGAEEASYCASLLEALAELLGNDDLTREAATKGGTGSEQAGEGREP